MALVKYTDGITPIRGKVLGTVFQTGKYGAVIKGKHSSQGQLLRKNLNAQEAMSKVSTLFDTLTPAQKNNWELARTSFPTEDRYGNPKISTAREVFMRTIARKPIDFQTALPIPRLPYTGAQINPGSLQYVNNKLIFSTDSPPPQQSFSLSLFVSPPLSLGRTTSAPKMVRLMYMDAYQGALNLDLTAAYESVFGTLPQIFSLKYCIEIYNQNTPQILSNRCALLTTQTDLSYTPPYSISQFQIGIGLRLLKSDYQGPLINCVDQNLQNPTDFYPDNTGRLDVDAFRLAYGSDPAFIKAFYNQATGLQVVNNEGTQADLFLIYDGTNIITDARGNQAGYNNRTSGERYYGNHELLSITNDIGYFASFSVQQHEHGTQLGYLFRLQAQNATIIRSGLLIQTNRVRARGRRLDSDPLEETPLSPRQPIDTPLQITSVFNYVQASLNVFSNKNHITGLTPYHTSGHTSPVDSSRAVVLGSSGNASNFLGYFSEMLLYNTDQSAYRTALEDNQMKYYAIP